MSKFLLLLFSLTACLVAEEKTVFITSVVRDQAHLLPRFLQTIEHLDYDKKLLSIQFYTYNNDDETSALLFAWAKQHLGEYKQVNVECYDFPKIPKTLNFQIKPLTFDECKNISALKDKGLQKAKECDYYFYLNPTAFVTPPTLKELIEKDKPIIAPLLKCFPECDDNYANFFYKINEEGYYAHDQNYIKILFGWEQGVFQVPLVHSAFLIKAEYLDKLSFSEEKGDFDFIIFGRHARKNGVEQYIANEKNYGVQIHFFSALSRDEEKRRLRNILLLP